MAERLREFRGSGWRERFYSVFHKEWFHSCPGSNTM
jgi:hypothetical protein